MKIIMGGQITNLQQPCLVVPLARKKAYIIHLFCLHMLYCIRTMGDGYKFMSHLSHTGLLGFS